MDTSTEEDLSFEYREIPEIAKNKMTKNRNQNEYKEIYLERYMKDKKRPVIQEDILEKLNGVKKKYGFRSYDKTIEHLCNLDTKIDPIFKRKYSCKTCNDPIEIPEGANVNKFVHSDLCTDKSCKGHIVTETGMWLDPRDNTVISKNDKKKQADVIRFEELVRLKKTRNEQKDTSEEQSEEQSEQGEELFDTDEGKKTLEQIFKEIDEMENTSESVKEMLKDQWKMEKKVDQN